MEGRIKAKHNYLLYLFLKGKTEKKETRVNRPVNANYLVNGYCHIFWKDVDKVFKSTKFILKHLI